MKIKRQFFIKGLLVLWGVLTVALFLLVVGIPLSWARALPQAWFSDPDGFVFNLPISISFHDQAGNVRNYAKGGTGIALSFHNNGNVHGMTMLMKGRIAGPQLYFTENGNLWGVTNHDIHGNRIGKTILFRPDGSVEREEIYGANGKLESEIRHDK